MMARFPPYTASGSPPPTILPRHVGHHLVEDGDGAVPVAEREDLFEETRLGRDDPHVADHGLQDDGGDRVPARSEESAERGDVVVREGQRVGGGGHGDACRVGDAERRCARAGLHKEEVGVAVVAALELHDGVAPGEAAGNAESGHRGLGAARDGAEHLDGRVEARDLLGEADLELRRSAEGGAVDGCGGDGANDVRVGVTEDERPPRADVVDVLRPIGAVEVRAFAARDEDGLAAYGAERAYGAVHAAGDEALGALEEGSGDGVAHAPESIRLIRVSARCRKPRVRRGARRSAGSTG
jgi:hypothetical protein